LRINAVFSQALSAILPVNSKPCTGGESNPGMIDHARACPRIQHYRLVLGAGGHGENPQRRDEGVLGRSHPEFAL
jgi:hypothetical protein